MCRSGQSEIFIDEPSSLCEMKEKLHLNLLNEFQNSVQVCAHNLGQVATDDNVSPFSDQNCWSLIS